MPKWLCSVVDFYLHFVNVICELTGLTILPFYDSFFSTEMTEAVLSWLVHKCGSHPLLVPTLILLTGHKIDPQNNLVWKTPLGSWSPTVNLALLSH